MAETVALLREPSCDVHVLHNDCEKRFSDVPLSEDEDERLEDDDVHDVSDFNDSFGEDDFPKERWAPLGATSPPPPPTCVGEQISHEKALAQLKTLEEDQEELNQSLVALTTHFARMQFRLRQIVDAPSSEKEDLLKELEEFAFKGIPDARSFKESGAAESPPETTDAIQLTEKERAERIAEQREKQQQLISQLKSQLNELETYAYESGTAEDVPTCVALEKQKLVIDEMREKLKLDLDNIDKLSTDELKHVVDSAIGQIVNPAKVKEMVVEQLKTQVTDLERFIEFLQGEAQTPGPLGSTYRPPTQASSCSCSEQPCVHAPLNNLNNNAAAASSTAGFPRSHHQAHHSEVCFRFLERFEPNLKGATYQLMKSAMMAIQLFIMTNLGCSSHDFQRNVLKRTVKGNHWGDMRARLELSIDKILALAQLQQDDAADYTSDSDESEVAACNQELTSAVRKEFAPALRDLIQHGLIEMSENRSLVPFGCFSSRRKDVPIVQMMHAWHLLVKYYEMKHGKDYNNTPARKLSEAFDLSSVGGKAITAKQTLLSAVGNVLTSHGPLRRSPDAHFKAFVCIALNQKKLVPWLRLVLRNVALVDTYYQPWSYIAKTGFEDSFRSLDRLASCTFNLPVDLAVRQLHAMGDAF